MVYWFIALLLPLLVQSHPISLPFDCEDVFKNGSIHSGVYTIYPVGQDTPMEVYCDMGCTEDEKHEGQWTVIQRRIDGTWNFVRTYDQYKEGFGDKHGEYWLGLENMHLLTSRGQYALRVDIEDFKGSRAFALYRGFLIESAWHRYRLLVYGFTDGGAGDSLVKHSGRYFTTFDKDHDLFYYNCAANNKGGFWFHKCLDANPNGQYQWKKHSGSGINGVYWSTWSSASLKAISMKIKRLPKG